MKNNLAADNLFIHQLKLSATIGVLPHEQAAPQTLIVDIAYGIEAAEIATLDQIDHTIDYATVRETILFFFKEKRFQLLETLAHRLAEFLLERFSIPWVRVKLRKPQVFHDTEAVGIEITRSLPSSS